jgi:hypothetical protein
MQESTAHGTPQQPTAIVTAEQYRFLRYALELADRFGAAPGTVPRLRAALARFEQFISPPDDQRHQ